MFTGIVETMGTVASMDANPFGMRFSINPGDWDYKPAPGDSVAVNGCCLTHAPQEGDDPGLFWFDAIRETLDKTNLGELSVGKKVNLEPALTPDKAMGGHFVQGHIDAMATVAEIVKSDEEVRVAYEIDRQWMPYIVPKGSVTIDGVSLTIASVDLATSRFEVALIPTTLAVTIYCEVKVGDTANIETDMIARTIVHYLEAQFGENEDKQGLTVDKLRDAGFQV